MKTTDLEKSLAALGRASAKVRARGEPAFVKLAQGATGVEEGAVVVVVLGEQGALVSRSKVRGKRVSLRDLRLRLAGAEAAVERMVEASPFESTPQLASGEASLLDEAGFTEANAGLPGALERAQIEMEILARESLSLEQAAKALGVTTGRLRQRLSPSKRTLFGFKEGRAWRIPRFQFDRHRKLVRGIDQVLPRIRPDVHPLAVMTWFATPHPDLIVGTEDAAATPLAWLAAGRSPDEVAVLAAEL